MRSWSTDELDRIAAVDEVDIAPRRADGSLRQPTTIWVVRDGDDLFVRSWHGMEGHWWRSASASHTGRITADGMEMDVTFSDAGDPDVNDRVDAAYRAKYGRHSDYVEPMVADQARATTLRLAPQG